MRGTSVGEEAGRAITPKRRGFGPDWWIAKRLRPLRHTNRQGFGYGPLIKHHARQLWVAVFGNLRAACKAGDREEHR
ncbi:hypothetical protein GCM10011363_28320 [Marivita lacus]|uniref:Transposase DDE domain-containing protein n=1 Tax=Marivita lacus TaxID=1323742 RepID=A0ABQ1KUT6_9RHOB|nr:hypothetical protein GCM10011363_28320 [Marivita lacus]